MKAIIQIMIVTAVLAVTPLFSLAQPPHPGGSGSGGASPVGAPGSAPVSGGGAPVDGGLSILLAMGTLYGGRKIYQWKKSI